jgi:hypothetical protein
MIQTLRDLAIGKVFGGGIQGSLAEKGIDWLLDETRAAISAEPESLEAVKLQPGETYTVIARPPATRRERKLAAAVDALTAAEANLSRATRRQKRTARHLAKAQRRLDRRRPGTTRYLRAARAEARLAQRFDKAMTPSKKLIGVRSELASAARELERSRATSLRSARAGHRRKETSTVYR